MSDATKPDKDTDADPRAADKAMQKAAEKRAKDHEKDFGAFPVDEQRPGKKPPVVPIRVLSMRSDRPLQLPGGNPPMYSITANEYFAVEFLPAWGVYRIVYTPRAGSSAQAWERLVPLSWASAERMPL